jgi:hypothetical protein
VLVILTWQGTVMSITAYLDGLRFDPETTRLMGVAFEMALVALRHTDGVDPPLTRSLERSSSLRTPGGAIQSSVSAAGCEESDLLVMFFMAWSPVRRTNAG